MSDVKKDPRSNRYVLVEAFPEDSKSSTDNTQRDSKSQTLPQPQSVRDLLAAPLASGGLSASANFKNSMKSSGIIKSMKIYPVDLTLRITTVSGANVALTAVTTLIPNSSGVTEATNFAALFDEYRCRSFSIMSRVYDSTSTAAISAGASWGVVYDPSNSGAYTSLVGQMLASQHIGPIGLSRAADGGLLSETPSGYIKRTFHVPPGGVTPTPSAGNPAVGRMWIPTTDTASCIGYLKPYVDPLGSAITSAWDCFVIYHCEYRSRS